MPDHKSINRKRTLGEHERLCPQKCKNVGPKTSTLSFHREREPLQPFYVIRLSSTMVNVISCARKSTKVQKTLEEAQEECISP
uniref:Uncharacterized protein n=1 Tax=Romanomermis culicivorax TaxID=13658 RepID=A0A915J3U7_ROMCU